MSPLIIRSFLSLTWGPLQMDHLKVSRVLMTGKWAALTLLCAARSLRVATSQATSSAKKAAGASLLVAAAF